LAGARNRVDLEEVAASAGDRAGVRHEVEALADAVCLLNVAARSGA
jgi:hypothetical protein